MKFVAALMLFSSQCDVDWAHEQLKELLNSNWDSRFEKEDLLPAEEKGEELKELKSFMTGSSKKQKFERTEKLFQESRSILDNPKGATGIISTQIKTIPEETTLLTCQEAGTYQIAFQQKRIAQTVPPVMSRVKRCKGHVHLSEYFFLESSAKEALKQGQKAFSQDRTLEGWNANISAASGGVFKKYVIFSQWKHKDNTENCHSYTFQEVVIQPAKEEDFWEADNPELLSSVERNPNCTLLYSQVLEGPEKRKEIFRDSWARQLFFSCEPHADSPCAKLRNQGGILTKKKCLKENLFGECDLWEKTYDIGKKAARMENTHRFEKEKIWGLNGELDSSYDKNPEMGFVVSTLSVFADLKKDLEHSGRNIEENIEIFRGEKMQCQCSFIKGVLYDCCKKMRGLAVSTHLASCNAEEQALASRRQEGKCHYIGSKKEKLGAQTSQVFCCFSTKLSRILHEEGRKQLGIEWGNAENPSCRGLSLSELQHIDFTKINFSDAIEDISINKEELLKKIRTTIEQLETE